MTWTKSLSCFNRHKHYLDKILQGQYWFAHSNPESLARIIRGMIRGSIERGEQKYASLARFQVHVVSNGVDIVERGAPKKLFKSFKLATVFDALLKLEDLANEPDSTTYYIQVQKMDNADLIQSSCESMGFTCRIKDNEFIIGKK